jgi:protein O-GlcNAc transferase
MNMLYMASQLHIAGNLEQARHIFREILKIQPEHADALHSLGILENDLGNQNIALQLIATAIKLKPGDANIYNSMGHMLKEQGNLIDASSFFQRAIELKPDIADFYFNLAAIFQIQKKFEQAEKNYIKALELSPDNYRAHANLGAIYTIRGNFRQAEISFQNALEYKKDSPEIYNNLGSVQHSSGNLVDAEKNYNQAIALNNLYYEAYNNLAVLYTNTGNLTEAEKKYRKTIELDPDFSPARSNLLLLLQYRDNLTREEWRSELDLFSNRFSTPDRKFKNDPVRGRKLKIGYVSADFRNHSCFSFIEPLLKHHDRSMVEITCFAEVDNPDRQTGIIRELADAWYFTAGMSDREMASLIEKAEIDILVDLTGHTFNNRLAVFAIKPAPVQTSWLGFPGSTGLKAIDYRISDQWLTPADSPEYYSETVWNLDRLSHSYQAPPDSPDIDVLPCLNNGYITFCSFNNLSKITEKTIQLWASVLKNIPDSRIILKAKYLTLADIKENLINLFGKHGIAPDRIDFYDITDSAYTHLDYYNKADIALDTYPYNGATTTMEALWMGVPVISLAGDRTASRYGLSFLENAGLADLAVNTTDSFIKAAEKLAADKNYLSALRKEMRNRIINSHLMDYSGFAQSIEGAYRQMWENWCNNR